ncbi:MAG: SMC-Scp complex subunit ScpB, partial [Fimbriimonadaceae bacterium]|nr:SMC-Scp complex subunit ScpB [Alphaproteobacteria bacterium]
RQQVRMVEALLFAAEEPLDEETLANRLPDGADVVMLVEEVRTAYASRGVNLVKVAGKWMMRTAEDLSFLMQIERVEEKRLSRAALETLAIIAYHQPSTRAEIEEIRGVSISKGTLDVLMEAGWIRMRGRRKAPGRPVTYGTTEEFMLHFGLDNLADLPGVDELKAAGLLSNRLPASFSIPIPRSSDDLDPDEDPLDELSNDPDSFETDLPDEDESDEYT